MQPFKSGLRAWVAQLVEQRIENPRVGGSNPPPGTMSSLFADRRPVPVSMQARGQKQAGCALGPP